MAEAKFFGPPDDGRIELLEITDLSQSGAGVIATREMPLGQCMILKFTHHDTTIVLKARFVRKKSSAHGFLMYGLTFIDPSRNDFKRLMALLEEAQAQAPKRPPAPNLKVNEHDPHAPDPPSEFSGMTEQQLADKKVREMTLAFLGLLQKKYPQSLKAQQISQLLKRYLEN